MEISQIRARREEIIRELSELEPMRRGSITEQYLEAAGREGERKRRGPYPLYSYKEKGRTISRRLKSREEVERYRCQIDNFRRFEGLIRELVQIGEKMCERSEVGVEKKRRRPPSKSRER